jgi:hypothetical protein
MARLKLRTHLQTGLEGGAGDPILTIRAAAHL